jgi:hypothetical protein
MTKNSGEEKREEDSQENKSRDRWTRVLSIIALVVSLVSVAFQVWRELETRHYARLAARPFIQFEKFRVPYAHRDYVGIYMGNYGTGAATLQKFVVYLDDQPFQSGTVEEVIKELGLSDSISDLTFMQELPRIMPADQEPWCVIGFRSEDYTQEKGRLLWDALSRISIHVEYSSVYGVVYEKDLIHP